MQLQLPSEKEAENQQAPQEEPKERPKERSPKPKQNRKGKVWVLALLAAGLLGAGVTGYKAMQSNAPKADITALTVPVESKNLTVRISASGAVQPVQRVNLSPKTQGRLAELYVEQGDRVETGQIVARMESAEIEAQLRQSQARLDSAKARLAKSETGSRPEEITQARARVEQVAANLAQLRAGSRSEEIAEAEARLEQARSNLADAQAGGSLSQEIAQAESRIEASKATVDLASQKVRRYQDLMQQGAISEYTFEEYKKEERTALANLQEAQRRLEQLKQSRRAEIERRQLIIEQERQSLKRLQNGSRPEEITKGEAELAEAQSKLEQLLNGTRPEEIAQAKADVAEAEASVQFYQVQLDDTKISAPFAGIITQKYATEGAFVTPATSASESSSATSTSIVALAKDLEVLAKVPEADIGQIKPNQTVEIVADAFPDKVFKGSVRLIAPEAVKERDVTLFQVRVAIAEGKEDLQSGMNVDLRFLGAELSNALVVPTVAIVTNKGQTGLLIPDENNQPKFQPITIGSTIGNQIQVLEGIKAGDRVFLELPQGQKLEDVIKTGK